MTQHPQGQWGAPQQPVGGPQGGPQQAYGSPQQPAPTRAPGTDPGSDISAALSWMWAAFSRNVAAFLVPGIVYGILMFGILTAGLIGMAVMMVSAVDDSSASGPSLGMVAAAYAVVIVASAIAGIPSLVWSAGTERAAVRVIDGGRPTIGEAMVGPGRVILTALLVMVTVLVGTLLCYIPGLIASFLFSMALPAAARGARPVEAMKESFHLVRSNIATVLLGALLIGALSSVASMFILTIVVTIPLSVLFNFALYERLHGRELKDPAPAAP